MKRTITLTALALISVVGFSSCTTSYDAYGRPIQTVDPGAAAVGALAIGAAGYAIGHNSGGHGGYYGGGHGGYYGGGHGGGYYGGHRGGHGYGGHGGGYH